MSTLLSDLDGAGPAPGGDGDLVNQIMREMNMGGGAQGPPPPMPGAPPPPTPANLPPMMAVPSNPTAVNQHVMATNPQTAHMINGVAPTNADFAAAMHGGVPTAQPQMLAAPQPAPKPYEYPRRGLRQRLTEEIKFPILVALLVFVFSLPVVNLLFAHYLPRFVMNTGQLTLAGLVIKSAAAGAVFWLMQRVIVPLFSM
jgi:hypothetical protein